MKLEININGTRYDVFSKKTVSVIAVLATLVIFTFMYLGKPSQHQLDYYKYKTDQYRNVIHGMMAILQDKPTPKLYNIIAKDMNRIGLNANAVGIPISKDEAADYVYKIIEPPVDSVEDSL